MGPNGFVSLTLLLFFFLYLRAFLFTFIIIFLQSFHPPQKKKNTVHIFSRLLSHTGT